MATSPFPAAIPTYTDLDGALTLGVNNHSAHHNQYHADISAVATKIGVGATNATPTNGKVLTGGATAGTSSWQDPAPAGVWGQISGTITAQTDLVSYINSKALGQVSNVYGEAPTGAVNGSNATFTTSQGYIGNTLQVSINGLFQTRGTDFAETTPGSGTFTLTPAPLTGDVVRASYQYAVGTGSGNSDTVDGFNAASTPTAGTLLPLNANSQLPGNVLGNLRLYTEETTDFANGIPLTAGTWTDFRANQNFTVASSQSIIMININTCTVVGNASTANTISSRLVIDSGGTAVIRRLGGNNTQGATISYINPFSGAQTVVITGLAAGVHTVKSQVRSGGAGNSAYCRPATNPDFEFYSTTVTEIGG